MLLKRSYAIRSTNQGEGQVSDTFLPPASLAFSVSGVKWAGNLSFGRVSLLRFLRRDLVFDFRFLSGTSVSSFASSETPCTG
jgi:hypothetical protein